MTGDPRILDEGEGSELKAQTITLGTRTRAVSAHGNVRHSIARRTSGKRPGMFGSEQPTLFVCRDFEYEPKTRTARYQENALVRSGPTRCGPRSSRSRSRLRQAAHDGERRHDVAAAPALGQGDGQAAGARRRAQQGDGLRGGASKVVYKGDVEIRQGDILTKSPEATAFLTKDGNDVERLLAGEPVEVHQGQRRANGDRGVYTPSDETFVLTGEKVVLFDVDRRLEGRILTVRIRQ
jgi:lipopolysaccharide export system protein LptA